MKDNTNTRIVRTKLAESLRKSYHHYGTTGKSVMRFHDDCRGVTHISGLHMSINWRVPTTPVSTELARKNRIC